MAIQIGLLSLLFCLLVLCPVGCFALQWEWQGQGPWQRQQGGRWRHRQQSEECNIRMLNAATPTQRLQAEAGVTEYWDHNHQQFRCAGVVVVRHILEPKGLLLPFYSNAPHITYCVQGSGIMGVTIPGCQETYQSESRSERGSERLRDEHQKIRRFREGDVFAMPAGVAKWIYNDGDSPAICVTLYDISSSHNQLDQNLRNFYLAGNPQQREFGSERRRRSYEEGNNIFTGFDQDLLADAYGVSVETINKLQGVNDNRGNIVRVERSLEVLRPEWRLEEEEIREERRRESENGIEETFCIIKLIENTNNPSMADLFNPRGGRITTIDSKKLTILDYLQLSAERVVLYRNAIMAPHWHVNAHSVVYVTRGSGRIQVANDNGRLVFDQQVQEGQLLVIPQNYVVVKKASSEGLEFVAFKTNGHAIGSTLAGEGSAMRGMPMEVLMNSFRVSREDARRLKYGRREMVVFGPRRSARSREGEDPFSIV